MRDKTAENFCAYFVEGWRARYNDEPPQSPVIWAYLNKQLEAYAESVALPQFIRRGKVPVPYNTPLGGTRPIYDERLNVFKSLVGTQWLYWSHDSEGEPVWHEKIRPGATVSRPASEPLDGRELYARETRGF